MILIVQFWLRVDLQALILHCAFTRKNCHRLSACIYKLVYMSTIRADVSFDGTQLQEWRCANQDIQSWVDDVRKATKCKCFEDQPDCEKLMKLNKESLVKLIMTGYDVTYSYDTVFDTFHRDVENMKTDVIESQKEVIKLQKQLLEVQSENLDTVKKTVGSVIEETVEKEIKLYSQAVSKTTASATPAITKEDLKTVLKTVVSEEDRSKNFIIFGLREAEQEDVSSAMNEVLQEIDEKPKFEAARVGKRKSDQCRPIKVTVSNSNVVHQILIKAKTLRNSDQFKRVYIDMDRSHEERQLQKELVQTMKEMSAKCSDKLFYIRSGKIYSRDRK